MWQLSLAIFGIFAIVSVIRLAIWLILAGALFITGMFVRSIPTPWSIGLMIAGVVAFIASFSAAGYYWEQHGFNPASVVITYLAWGITVSLIIGELD